MKVAPLVTHTVVLLLVASLMAACGKTADNTVTPVEITKDSYCSLDGMLLGDYPGPKAQIHYAGQPEPELFCDTTEMFSLLLKPEQARKVTAAYVQDLDKTSWDAPKGAWTDAKTAFYVVGSKKRGAMGPTIPSFGTREGAQKFADSEGGKVYPFAEITPDMARLDGGALQDQRM
ncbi:MULTISPECIES: nitrous oxide reductase accessory protein NosL [Zoogloea]|jgi:copper chaperone NosL|uniref:nitrous oxide reductase accessory protein NosL n=1 Tax=Zoogloea TaxID=349 RepID=UPI001B783257|nr:MULTISPECIES: nitrous oxide reductase accessory protein NosL [Zoogloea]MBP6801528.1 nitrous oxide reductase accessory protein NosL [Zoogloea sp.]MBT9498585.1 nitrous oxide reductase accessory protein NosL [Zoogloea sp.]MDD2669267.1 nitrous oxide reductase accessory protein NosL [Zoogloea sp.]MDY0036522.1 nitrous oxide reductase accessory protein NosL [Zoogloea oleivorans]